MVKLEICAGSIEHALEACSAGASRIELNSCLCTGGLTPSTGVVREIREATQTPLAVMIRPRPGGFVYSPAEKRAILHDAGVLRSMGADCLVVGALLPSGGVDSGFIEEVLTISRGCQVVFHRAVDTLPDIYSAVGELTDLGVDRVLTSGGRRTAWEGRGVIAELQRVYGDRIEILPGSGINSGNARRIVTETGCRWLHGSFRGRQKVLQDQTEIVPPEPCGPSSVEIRSILDELAETQ